MKLMAEVGFGTRKRALLIEDTFPTCYEEVRAQEMSGWKEVGEGDPDIYVYYLGILLNCRF